MFCSLQPAGGSRLACWVTPYFCPSCLVGYHTATNWLNPTSMLTCLGMLALPPETPGGLT